MPRHCLTFLFVLLVGHATTRSSLFAAPPSFTQDVMAVLSKAGCNSGACHGNLNGKGGLKFSLRGENPLADFQTLTRDGSGRRLDLFSPDSSLVLAKPSGQISHQGGVRLRRGSTEYAIVRDWIAGGAAPPANGELRTVKIVVTPAEQIVVEPVDSVPLKVIAMLSDGTARDVTTLACYETSNLSVEVGPTGVVQRKAFGETTVIVRYLDHQTPVRLAFIPSRPDFTWQAPAPLNYVDELVFSKLQKLRMNPSAVVDDSVFVRRAYLDVLGLLPTADESRKFVDDSTPDKRARLIDELLQRPEFADHWALKWADLLRVEEKVLDAHGVDLFHRWIRDSLQAGMPLDQFVRELVAGRGSTYTNPPANYYRANRDATTRGETTARLFLGVRLQCAQCHNHPFDRWTQDDYYSWATIFSRVDYKIIENKKSDKFDSHAFDGEQIVEITDAGETKNARTGRDATPCFLGADAATFDATADRLQTLATWLTQRENIRFAQTQVNFIWYHLLGRGLVEPIDDFRATNPAVNPQLLDQLTADFIANRFDLRHMVRVIMNAQTYQFAVEPNETNRDDDANFSRAVLRRLTAEKLLDAQCQVLGTAAQFNGFPAGLRAGQIPGVRRSGKRDKDSNGGDRFLKTFGKPERLLACECERSNETTLGQVFTLIGGTDLNDRLSAPNNQLQKMIDSGQSDNELIYELYWTALTRPPNAEELSTAAEHLDASADRLASLQDLAWALLNSKEFVFRR